MQKALADLTLHQEHTFYPHPFSIGYSATKIERVPNEKMRFVVNLKILLVLLHQDQQKHFLKFE